MKDFLRTLTDNASLIYLKKDFENNFSKLSSILFSLDFLKETSPSDNIECPGCEEGCLKHIVREEDISDYFYVSCETLGLVKIKKDLLENYKFKLFSFLKWINEQLKLEDEVREENPQGLIWFLGKKNNITVFFIRSDNVEDVNILVQSIAVNKRIVLWLGRNTGTNFYISLFDLIYVKRNKLQIKSKLLNDKHIFIQQNLHQNVQQKRNVVFSEDYRTVDIYEENGNHISEIFTDAQAKVVEYLYNQHEKGLSKIHQKTILDGVNSFQIRMADVFKVNRNSKTQTHPLFNKLIVHDKKGSYWLNLSSNSEIK